MGDILSESDYSIVHNDEFLQYEFIDDEERKAEPYTVTPGIFAIHKTMAGLVLLETAFNVDRILQTYSYSADMKKRIATFFSRFHIYTKRGQLPIRKFLIYGPAGTGKSTCIVEAIDEYTKDLKTVTIVWHTDKFEASHVKDFMQSFEYKGVDKVILLIEDIGGVEREQGIRPSESSLLSLLDNKEQTFKIPTLVLATTNYPETLLGNLTNRPGRFSDKIEISWPKAAERLNLLKFFCPDVTLSDRAVDLITGNKTNQFTPDHIRNLVENSELYDKTIEDAIDDMVKDIGTFSKSFGKEREMGIFSDD